MTIVIKKTDTKEVIDIKLASFYASNNNSKSKGFNAKKYVGKLKGLYGDPVKYQKRLRDEW